MVVGCGIEHPSTLDLGWQVHCEQQLSFRNDGQELAPVCSFKNLKCLFRSLQGNQRPDVVIVVAQKSTAKTRPALLSTTKPRGLLFERPYRAVKISDGLLKPFVPEEDRT